MKRILFSVLLIVSLFALTFVVSHVSARRADASAVNMCSASGVLGFTPTLQFANIQPESASLAAGTINTCTDPAYPWASVSANATGNSSCSQLYLSGFGNIVWQDDPSQVSTFSFTISTSLTHLNQVGLNGKIIYGPLDGGKITAVGVINPLDLLNCATHGTNQITFTFAELLITEP